MFFSFGHTSSLRFVDKYVQTTAAADCSTILSKVIQFDEVETVLYMLNWMTMRKIHAFSEVCCVTNI